MRNLCHSRSETHAFHTCAAHLSVFLICLSYRQCPIRPFGAPSPRGEGFVSEIATLSYTMLLRRSSLPLFHTASTLSAPSGHLPLEGEGFMSETATLSYTMLLRRSPPSFIPPLPYPPLRGTFPSRGRLCPSLSVSPHILVFALTI